MSTPLGEFIRAKRDSIQPETFGLPVPDRRRSPGLRRVDLATRAGISVEYLARIEQGRDRSPSTPVVNALADALSLDPAEREHLRYLAKITGGGCPSFTEAAPAPREVRAPIQETVRLLEPGLAVVTNRLGDLLAHTDAYATLMAGTGLLDGNHPNLTRYVFTDPRSRELFPQWDEVADEQAFDLWHGPSAESFRWFTGELAGVAGPEFTRRLSHQLLPRRGPLSLRLPSGQELVFQRETLELSSDSQQLVVYLAADEVTVKFVAELRPHGRLRAIG